MSDAVRLATSSPEETQALAAAFAPFCRSNDVIGLVGTLGAGKTCFVKGLAAGLGARDPDAVISPTFVLQRRYEGRLTLHHFDAYRLHGGAALDDIGAADTFRSGGVSVVEWADHVADSLPAERFTTAFTVDGERSRRIVVAASGVGPRSRMGAIAEALRPWRA